MAKAPRRYRGVDLEARRKTFGEIYVWLYRHHDGLVRDIAARTPALWAVRAKSMELEGVLSKNGRVPTRHSVQKAWVDVARHHPEDAERYATERRTNTGSVISRHKGWVPKSTEPLPPSPGAPPSVSPPSRMAAPVATASLRSLPPEATPTGHVPHPMTVSRNYLTGDDPLANLTADEAAKLAVYVGADREFLLSMLKTFRKIAHLDRHNVPPK